MQSSNRGHRKQADSFGGPGAGWTLPPLTLANTLALHAGFAAQGATDASRLTVAGQLLTGDKVIQANVVKSSVCQGLVLVSALVIKPILRRLVGLRPSDPMISSVVFFAFHLLWLYPVAAAATYYSGLLRPAAETDRRRNTTSSANDRGQIAQLVSESYRTLVTLNYFVFFYALRLIPLLGGPLSFLYASVVSAYYCFEAHWVKNGWPFGDRVRQIEQRWAYAFGFGLPITLLSWWSSDPVVNLAIFALLYPLFSLTSTAAIPQPLDPSLPAAASSAPSFLRGAAGFGHGSFSIAAAEGGEEDRGRKGNAWVPTRIRVLLLAELAYAALTAAFGVSSGGAGGMGGMGGSGAGRKKDAGIGHGHGASPARMAMAQRINSFDPHYGAPTAPATGSPYGSPVRARTAAGAGAGAGPERYSMESDPYHQSAASSAGPYAGSNRGQATPPRRGYVSEYASPVAAGGAGPYDSPYAAAAAPAGAPPPPQPAFGLPSGGGGGAGFGMDKTLDSYIRQAGMRGKNKGD